MLHRMLSAEAQVRLKPIQEEYPGLSVDAQVFILEFRTGIEQLIRTVAGVESSALAGQLDALEAIRIVTSRPAPAKQPKRAATRRRIG